VIFLVVRRRASAVSNHEAPMLLILRDAAKTPLLRMRALPSRESKSENND
jgi:hypothetical protein